MLNLCVLGEVKLVISLGKCMKSILFKDLFARRLPYKYYGRRRLIQRSILVNEEVSFTIDFMSVFRENFPRSLPTFLY